MSVLKINTVRTQAIDGQKPGTSGLRKPTRMFLERNYTHNFVQAILNAGTQAMKRKMEKLHTCLVLGGDGRFFVKEALTNIIIPMCAANGVDEVIVGKDGILSTPAAAALICKTGAQGGILLTASHNPGGIDADFGIKYNIGNGGPATENITNAIYEDTKVLSAYRFLENAQDMNLSLDNICERAFKVSNGSSFKVRVVSSTSNYLEYMKEIFDFPAIKSLLAGTDQKGRFKLLVTGLNGVMGPYIHDILCKELNLPEECAIQATPLPDFGGLHPDPNLTYAKSLVEAVQMDPVVRMAVAFDGDGDRNMILGNKGFFVCPCDSLAVIADNIDSIPFFAKNKAATAKKGFARSMPTSRAIDVVCEKKGLQCFEVPTGWKFFGNLMDAGLCAVCGEESFGTGSEHIREKDGMWTLLAWLTILVNRSKEGKTICVEAVIRDHWNMYGRHFFTRYDYENCTTEQGAAIMKRLNALLSDSASVGKEYNAAGKTFKLLSCDDFSYIDPIDHSESKNQGIRLVFDTGVRIVYRLSGTGSQGATLRVYLDAYETDTMKHHLTVSEYLKQEINLAVQICGVAEIAGRTEPTVIT